MIEDNSWSKDVRVSNFLVTKGEQCIMLILLLNCDGCSMYVVRFVGSEQDDPNIEKRDSYSKWSVLFL